MMDALRHVRGTLADGGTWCLALSDTGRTDWRGQSRLAYTFAVNGEELFTGADFCGSPMHADDSDATVLCLLGFLTLRPGDTDREYFEAYTEAQLDWAQSYNCEALSCDVSIAEETGEAIFQDDEPCA